MAFLSVRENERTLKRAQFQQVVVEPVPFRMKFETSRELLNYCKAAALVPFLSILPQDLHAEFEQQFLENLLAEEGVKDFELGMTRLFISADKGSNGEN